MKIKNLFQTLSSFGLPLMETQNLLDAGDLLAQISQSSEMRLLEGFPVVMANAAEKGALDLDRFKDMFKNNRDRSDLSRMVVMSLALYRVMGLKFNWANYLQKDLGCSKEFNYFIKNFKHNKKFILNGKNMSPERVKNIFAEYFKGQQDQLMNLSDSKEEFGLEFALAQVFSSKQKELFLKKFRGLPLNKTEREYYSRTVKKKILALANAELHKIARQLIR